MSVDRVRALSFGADPDRYDRARPSYPSQLVDDLVAAGARRVLDVGCGTGKVARLLVERGLDVLGIEADERMAQVARRHGVTVEVARFEEWDAKGRSFDLVVCGQAWHWVDQRVGPRKAAAILRSDGMAAFFWNRPGFTESTRRLLVDLYRKLAPDIAEDSPALGFVGRGRMEEHVERLAGQFQTVETRTYRWDFDYDASAYLELLQTYSDHLLLPVERRRALLDGVYALIGRLGGTITVHYATVAILARHPSIDRLDPGELPPTFGNLPQR